MMCRRHNLWHITLSMPPPHPVPHAQYVTLAENNLLWNCVKHEECAGLCIITNLSNKQFRVDSDEGWLIIIDSLGVGGSGREQQIQGLSGIYPGEINSDPAYTGSEDQSRDYHLNISHVWGFGETETQHYISRRRRLFWLLE